MGYNRDILHSQTKKVILHVYNYFRTMATHKNNLELSNIFRQTRELTAKACCDVSLIYVKKKFVLKQKKNLIPGFLSIAFKSPRKYYKRAKLMTNLDDSDNKVVRRTIRSFYCDGQFSTSVKILVALREKFDYPGLK